MFSPFGKIRVRGLLWHTCGPNRGQARGFAFVSCATLILLFSGFPPFEVSMQEAVRAKEKMNGRLACGSPLVVRFASERCYLEARATPPRAVKLNLAGTQSGQMSRSAKITAIKNKLKSLLKRIVALRSGGKAT